MHALSLGSIGAALRCPSIASLLSLVHAATSKFQMAIATMA
jgi:hypothetical protein